MFDDDEFEKSLHEMDTDVPHTKQVVFSFISSEGSGEFSFTFTKKKNMNINYIYYTSILY